MRPPLPSAARWLALALVCLGATAPAQAALFEDDEARKAILELRQRVDGLRTQLTQEQTQAAQAAQTARQAQADESRSALLSLQRQIEALSADVSALRGSLDEQLRATADAQRQTKDELQAFRSRLAALEPARVSLDGVDFVAQPDEQRAFESALATFRKGDFAGAQGQFVAFVGRYANSGYASSALFWLGNAQYATRDYKEAIANFRALVARTPEHLRAPEAVLSIANCQLELKDIKGARKTLADLIKAYPQAEAATAAKERLAALK